VQVNADLLTTAEAAAYLRLKERKLYELVSQGAIPCTKVTGRWLFPKAELDRWLAGSLAAPDGLAAVPPPAIVGGSHDPLLEWALRESGSGLATLPEGSEAGLARFAAGEVVAAAIHLHALDDADASASVGPDLNELAAVAEDREQGTSAEDYVREAIVDPPAFVVEGYSGDTMPGNYGDQLTAEEIDALVEYLLGLSQTENGE